MDILRFTTGDVAWIFAMAIGAGFCLAVTCKSRIDVIVTRITGLALLGAGISMIVTTNHIAGGG